MAVVGRVWTSSVVMNSGKKTVGKCDYGCCGESVDQLCCDEPQDDDCP